MQKCSNFQLKKRRSQSAHEVGLFVSSSRQLEEDPNQDPGQRSPLVGANENGNSKISPDIVVTRYSLIS
jgi:hypothetical protein